MRNNGFTILEVLLAIAVLGVVMAMLSLSLTATLGVINVTEQQEEVFHQAQTALRRLSEDLAGAVPHPDMGFTATPGELNGRNADTLTFASTSHLVFNPVKQRQGPAVIVYFVRAEEDDRRRLQLLRSDTLLLPGSDESTGAGELEAHLLADNLRAVRFRYLDRNGQEFDSWGGEVSIDEEEDVLPVPTAVFFTLEFWLDPDKETAQTFATGVLIPAGSVTAETEHEQ